MADTFGLNHDSAQPLVQGGIVGRAVLELNLEKLGLPFDDRQRRLKVMRRDLQYLRLEAIEGALLGDVTNDDDAALRIAHGRGTQAQHSFATLADDRDLDVLAGLALTQAGDERGQRMTEAASALLQAGPGEVDDGLELFG